MKNIWTKRNLKVLSPMAGYTDSAFRLLCREQGADIVVTELISADAIAYNKFKVLNSKSKVIIESKTNTSTADMLSFNKAEKPLIIQLFGKFPDKFAAAARWVSDNLIVDGIDINMGCPARKVVGSDHGAALLKNPKLACEIVRAVKSSTDLPVSVKTRLGWSDDNEILAFAPSLVRAGVNGIIIHGRTYKDGFSGKARWDNIHKVKELVGEGIGVIGNGDINNNPKFNPPAGRARVQNSKLNGVAIGRAAFGNPWIFRERFQLTDFMFTKEWKQTVLRHAELVYEMKGGHGIVEFRKHLLAYLKGFSGAKELRAEAVRVSKIEDVVKIINKIKHRSELSTMA